MNHGIKEKLESLLFTLCSQKSAKMKTKDDDIELLKLKYEMLRSILEREKDRNKTVESKASLFIGSTSIVGAILVGCSKLVSDGSGEPMYLNTIILLFMSVLVCLLSCAIWHSIQVLRKRTYWMLGIEDVENLDNRKDFYLKLIAATIKIIKHNEQLINDKVDSMEMAQRRFVDFGLFSIVYIVDLLVFKFLSIFELQLWLTSLILLLVVGCLTVMGYLFLSRLGDRDKIAEKNNVNVDGQITSVCFMGYSSKKESSGPE